MYHLYLRQNILLEHRCQSLDPLQYYYPARRFPERYRSPPRSNFERRKGVLFTCFAVSCGLPSNKVWMWSTWCWNWWSLPWWVTFVSLLRAGDIRLVILAEFFRRLSKPRLTCEDLRETVQVLNSKLGVNATKTEVHAARTAEEANRHPDHHVG